MRPVDHQNNFDETMAPPDAEILRRLQSVTDATLSHLSLEDLMRELLGRLRTILGVDTAGILLLTSDGQQLVPRASLGLEEPGRECAPVPVGTGFSGRIATERQPVIIEDINESDLPLPLFREKGVRTLMGVPLLVAGRVIGVVHVGTFDVRRFTPLDVQLLQLAADRCVLTLEHARLFEKVREVEEIKEAILHSSLGCILVMNREGHIIEFNRAAEEVFGYSHAEATTRALADLMAPSTMHEQHWRDLTECFATGEGAMLNTWIELTGLRADGTELPIELAIIPLPLRNHALLAGIIRDMTERKQAEEAVRESAERYELAVRGANDGLWDWNLKTDEIYYSPRWKAMLGFEENEIGNSPDEAFQRVHPADIEQLKAEIADHLAGRTARFKNEYRMLHRDGRYRWMLTRGIALRDDNGTAYRMAGSLTDLTEHKATEEQLQHDAFHDALTGLPNRALFLDRLGHGIELAKRREDYLFAVLFLDLDRFKVINDSLGHNIGDQLLMEVARRLGECRRPTDIIARMGGDEFTILLDGIKEVSDATRVANRIQKKLAAPYNLSGNEVFTSASIGIALSATGYDRPEDLLRDADIAMYRAKKLGKVRYQIFDRSMHARAVSLLQLESDLRRAVAREEFRVHYQPIVSSETGEISALEALVRWQHPERGLIPPAEFIALAEDTGMIVPLGLWVLREACSQMREWQTRFPDRAHLAISANLSIKQFSQPDLVAQIDHILQETYLSADDLKLEITESVIMENDRSAASTLSRLRDMGIHLCTDDFGTGYSSLSYLHRFPIDTLKIDRSFVSRMGVDGKDTEIVGAIITMAHGLDIEVVAEGVETAEQLTHLRRLQCEQGQGYYFSKPLDSQSLETLLSREPQWRNGSVH